MTISLDAWPQTAPRRRRTASLWAAKFGCAGGSWLRSRGLWLEALELSGFWVQASTPTACGLSSLLDFGGRRASDIRAEVGLVGKSRWAAESPSTRKPATSQTAT